MPGHGRNAVKYVQEDEPSFIKQFKEKIGYKEGPNVNTKHQQLEFDSDDEAPEKEDEKPTIVVLKDGDLTEDQADQAKKNLEKTVQSVDDITSDGKIAFKKPVKRSPESAETSDLPVSSAGKKKKDNPEKKSSKSSAKKVKNSSLLSFNDEEEED